MKRELRTTYVLGFIIVLMLVSSTAGAGREEWIRIQNASQGYSLHCPAHSTARRYDPEGILHIRLASGDEVMTIRVFANPSLLAIGEWTDRWLASAPQGAADRSVPALPMIRRETIEIGGQIAQSLVRAGPIHVQHQTAVAYDSRVYLISHPTGNTSNEYVFEQILSTLEFGVFPDDSGFAITELDTLATISSLPVPYYSQRDSRWICDQLGTCNCDFATCTTQTFTGIGDAGCFISSQAMIFEYYTTDHFMDPQEFDTCLTSQGAYSSWAGCSYGVCAAPYWPPESCRPSSVSYEGTGTSEDLAVLDADLSDGYPAIAWIDSGAHYVVVVGKESGKYQINDPYYSRTEIDPGEIEQFVRYHGPLPDQVPPTTTLSLAGTLGENGWFVSDVQATLTANEPVDWTKYRIDYEEWLVYNAAFDMDCDGIHPLQYHSTDLFGNEEVIRSATVKIGQTASPPDDPFSSRWKAWSPSSSVFSLDRCTPLHIGDVNGDALDDLVCPYDYGESTTKTLVQLSSGSDFSRWTEWSPQAVGTFDVNHCKPLHIGDINGDGFDDLVCPYDYGESTTKTLVQLSSGSDLSRWTEWSPIAEGTFAVDHCKPLHIGDVNGDGSDDLVCPYDYGESTTKTFVQLSSGSGFSKWTAWSPRAEGTFAVDHCKPLHIGDVNGDTLDDLVCPYDYGESTTKTFVQLSSGSDFSAWTAWSPQAVGTFDVNHCKPLHIGDVNGDGSYDLVCPYDYGNCRTKTLVQLSSGSDFSGWTAWSSDSYSLDVGNCKSLEISDANGDGRDDLVCPYDYHSNTTMTFVQLSTGTAFGDWIAWSPRNEGGFGLDNCKFLQVGSIEGDRHSDVICPYDYGDSTTQTWVQISSRFSIYLPLVVR